MFNYKNKFGVLSIIIGVTVFTAQNNISLIPVGNGAGVPKSVVKELELEEIYLANMLMFQKDSVTTCIDLREEKFYRYNHILGAINISLKKLNTILPEKLLKELKSSTNIIIYSNNYANDELRNAVKLLNKNGIENVKVYSAGWEEWKACKLPMEKSR